MKVFTIFNIDVGKFIEGKKSYTTIARNRDKSELKDPVLKAITKKLAIWESEKGFLDNSITLNSLAKKLNTNTAYLSKVVNEQKQQNFASYLKDIRITHAVNHLKENPEMVKTKSMIQIAEMYGFNSLSVFTASFKHKTAITPGKFFKQLLEDEWGK